MEVRLGIAALHRRLARAVLQLDALHRGLGFKGHALDREVIARQKLHFGLRHRREKLGRDIAFQQPLAVFENTEWSQTAPRRHSSGNADRIPAVPYEAVPSGRIKRLQKHRSQQRLRRDRRPPNRHREPANSPFQRRKRLVHVRIARSG
jgi:hypothetical protein